MDPIDPIERGRKYEDPLQAMLVSKGLGEVTGGGSSLGEDSESAWVGIDIEVIDLARAVPLIKQKLLSLGAPRGSVLSYKVGEKEVVVPIHDDADK